MSHNLEAFPLTEQPQQWTAISEASRSQEIVDACRRIIGRSTLVLGLILGPGVVAGTAAEVLDPHPTTALADTSGYPDASAPCVANNNNVMQGTGYWCSGYQWGYYIRDSHGNITGNIQNSSRGFGYRNCTDWAAFRAQQLTGVLVPYGNAMGDATDWDNNAPNTYTVDTTPEPGDIAVWDYTPTNAFGHVAVVESVNTNNTVNISEYNHGKDGNYGTRTNVTADHYIDINGTDKGINGDPVSGSGSSGRTAFINSLGAAYAKDELEGGGWHPLTGNNDALQISASGTHLALINSAGQAWGADVPASRLSANAAGLQPLNVPLEPNTPGGVKKIVTDKDGNMMAINNCGAAYGWRNVSGEQHWVRMAVCGDAYDVDVGSGRMALRNSCNGGYVSDIGYGWTPVLGCGDAKAIAIGETGRIMAINGQNTAYIYNPGQNTWVNKTGVGDAQRIAIGKDRIMVITSGGAAWGADVGQNNSAPMTQLTGNGDAAAITVGANDRMGLINSAGAGYASNTITAGGSWTRQTGNGDARLIAAG
jgi:surface antigen